MSEDLASRWSELLDWLERDHEWDRKRDCKVEWRDTPGAGRGLFYTQDVQPEDTILRVPASALLNAHTLSLHGEVTADKSFVKAAASRKLAGRGPKKVKTSPTAETFTSTQVLALYLAQHRYDEKSFWASYISTLPESFRPWHPLTWLIKPTEDLGPWRACNQMAHRLTPGAGRRLKKVHARYLIDKEVCLRNAQVPEEDFLWGWLDVNTRTLYLDFGVPAKARSSFGKHHLSELQLQQEDLHSEENNHTMAPIIDFANHCHSDDARACKAEIAVGESSTKTSAFDLRSYYYRLRAPASQPMRRGDEVVFAYGVHPDDVLFTDYGFISRTSPWDEVVVDAIIDDLWNGRDIRQARLKKEVLQVHDYLGDYTLHLSPLPSHPSHRLLPCLRLMHMDVSDITLNRHLEDPTAPAGADLRPFLAVIWGEAEIVSVENESRVRASLTAICDAVRAEAKQQIAAIADIEVVDQAGEDARKAVQALWESSMTIAQQVSATVASGVPF